MPTEQSAIRGMILGELAKVAGKSASKSAPAALLKVSLSTEAGKKLALRLVALLIHAGRIAADPALLLAIKSGAFDRFAHLVSDLERRVALENMTDALGDSVGREEPRVRTLNFERPGVPLPRGGARRRSITAVKMSRGPTGLKPRSPAITGVRPPSPPKALAEAKAEQRLVERTVFFATDRAPTDRSRPDRLRFDADRSKEGLILGRCQVSFPPIHKVGKLERPSIFRFEFKEDPRKHVVLKSVVRLDPDDFYEGAKAEMARWGQAQAFVFVHGFNVKFDAAAMKTAQLAHDLQFRGAAILYSWPSKGSPPLSKNYITDSTNAIWTVDHFTAFLSELAAKLGAERIHVIAHSMGNRIVCDALERISLMPAAPRRLHHMVFTAPDVDADTFVKRVKVFQPNTGSITLYASSKDKAIAISRRLNTEPRAGEPIVILPGVTSVDASDVETDFVGHGYFSDSRWVVSDVRDVFADQLPDNRFNLRPAKNAEGDYFKFRT